MFAKRDEISILGVRGGGKKEEEKEKVDPNLA